MSVDKKKERQMNEKKKAFIQEQIVPERNNRIKKTLLMAGAVAFCAVLFGVIASLTMAFAEPYFDEMAEKKNGDSVSLESEENNEETGEGQTQEADTEEKEESESKPETIVVEAEMTLDRIEECYALLRKTAKQYNACIVTVSGRMQGVDWFDNPSEMAEASFGVILAEDSERLYILTNYDSVQDVESIQITFANNATAEAKLRGKDKITSLAVLSVAKEAVTKETLDYIMVADLGDSYSLTEGTFVMALGSPNGYMHSMDFGMISGQKRDQAVLDGKLELFNTNMGYYSGGEGVVLDINGRVIGLITHDYDKGANSEVNTMIGISRLKQLIEKMINKQPLVHFGIIASDIPEAKKENLGVESGIYVTEAEGNSPALEAGIRAGDVIVEIEGTPVASIINFSNILGQHKPKDKLTIKVARSAASGTSEQEVTVVLGKR